MRTAHLAIAALFIALSPVAQAQESWTGMYVGGTVGNLSADNEDDVSDSATVASVIAGYNMEFGDRVVLGLEGDLTSDTLSSEDFMYTLRPRAGYKVNDAGLAFGSLGYAGIALEGANPEGWILGFGYEHQLTESINLRAEYLYSEQDLDGFDASFEFLRAGLTTKF